MGKEVLKKVKGEKYDDFPSKNTRISPTFRLTDEDLPELKDWKVGDKYKLVMEIEQMSVRQGNEYQGGADDKRVHATFKVLSVGVEESDADYEKEYAKRMGKPKK